MRAEVHEVDAIGPSRPPEIVEFAPQFYERAAASWGWQRRSRRPSIIPYVVFPDLGRAWRGSITAKKPAGEPKRMGISVKRLTRMSSGLRNIGDARPEVAHRIVGVAFYRRVDGLVVRTAELVKLALRRSAHRLESSQRARRFCTPDKWRRRGETRRHKHKRDENIDAPEACRLQSS